MTQWISLRVWIALVMNLPEVSVRACGCFALLDLQHRIMHIPTVGDDGLLPSEGERVCQGHDFSSLGSLMFPKYWPALLAPVARD